MSQIKTVDTYCHYCKHKTHHNILYSKEDASDAESEIYSCTTYCVVQCCGCDKISFLQKEEDECWVDQDDRLIPIYIAYPYQEGRVEPIPLYNVPRNIITVYTEALTAYNNNCPILAAAGFRATIEAICKHKEITGMDLKARINNLHKKGHITIQDRDRLHSIRFMGNDSIHEMKVPEQKDLELVLEIVNITLNNIYVLEAKTRGLEKTISSFKDFTRILSVHLIPFNQGDVVTLKQILNKDRRVMDEDRAKLEAELQTWIKNGDYIGLSLGNVTSSGEQEYIVNKTNTINVLGMSRV